MTTRISTPTWSLFPPPREAVARAGEEGDDPATARRRALREGRSPICVPGDTCMRTAHADRAAFLIDGDAYFRAFSEAVANAKRAIWIVGWDIDSRVHVNRDGHVQGLPAPLGEFLDAVVRRPHGPICYVLAWDFAVIYAFERETFTRYRLGFKTHRRLRFHYDDIHPVAASHHQKFVVVDDKIAFVGGLDLCGHRWDTPEHRIGDPRRRDPWKPPYEPFHDAQMAVDGAAAKAVGDYARERWFRATGERLRPVGPLEDDPWPAHLPVDVADVEVAIARTDPAYDGRPDVREVERMYVDSIRAARKWIYVENQYLTAHVVADALEESLLDPDGPEMVILQPRECCGWLEQSTMGILRAQVFARLKQADRYGRLRIWAPVVPDERGRSVGVNLHSKIMIVDDRFVHVGSANMSNRSLGFDTELDLAIEGQGQAHVAAGVRGLRARLLAEHLGTTADEVERAHASTGSLIAAVESLRGGPRTLSDLEPGPPEWLASLVPENLGVDPEAPSPADLFVDRVLPLGNTRSRRRPFLAATSVLAILCALAAAWKFTPLAEVIEPSRLRETLQPFVGHPLMPLFSIAAFVVGGLLMLPVTLLVFQAGVLFGPVLGFGIALAGALASAVVSYGVGRALGKDMVHRIAGRMRGRLSKTARRGVLAVAAIRLLPIAPFTVVNMAAGAWRVPFSHYVLGTAIGMAPGMLALTVFSDRLAAALEDPRPGSFLALVVALLVLLGTGVVARHFLLRRRRASAGEQANGALNTA